MDSNQRPTSSRRDFLFEAAKWGAECAGTIGVGSVLLSPPALAASAASTSSETRLLGGKYQPPTTNFDPFGYDRHSTYSNSKIYNINLRDNSIGEFAVRTPTHGIQRHPNNSNLLACSSKRSDLISIVDLKNGKETAFAQAPAGTFFNGHTVFADQGKYLIATCTDITGGRNTGKGFFQIYETPGLKPIDRIELGSLRAHDLVEIRPDVFVAGLFGGTAGSLHFGTFDFHKLKFVAYSAPLPVDREGKLDLSITHVSYDPRTKTVFGIANAFEKNRLTIGTICRFNCNSNEVSWDFLPGKHNVGLELLSLVYDEETNYLWATIPHQNAVLVWDVKTKALLTVIESWHFPQSVSLASNIDAIVIGSSAGLKAHHRKNFRHLPKVDHRWSQLSLNSYLAPHSRIL